VLARELSDMSRRGGEAPAMDNQDFQTVRIQLGALGLIKATYAKAIGGGMALFWSLTKQGERLLLETRTVRSRKDEKG
jgi:hypothetical protein